MNTTDLPIIQSPPTTTDEVRVALRTHIKAAQSWAYFDHAAVSPLPTPSVQAMQKFVEQAEADGDWHWPQWSSLAGRLRSHAAKLLHCQSSEIALIPNTTFGINLIAMGYRWETEQAVPPNVVVLENEFSSNLLPWIELEQRGVEVRLVKVDAHGVVDLDRIRQAIDRHTQLVSVSWVGYFTGYRLDLAKLCDMVHQAGAKLFVDAIQGLGVFPCNLESIPIDFLAADGHKWLLGPEGAGIMFIRQSNLDFIRPMMIGWGSLKAGYTFDNKSMTLKNDASRFEGGSANLVGQIGLERSVRLLLDVGCHQDHGLVGETVLENADHLAESLRRKGCVVYRDVKLAESLGSQVTGILTFDLLGQEPNQVRQRLINNKVMVSVRHGRVRAATHAYNNPDDIARLIDGLGK